MNIRSSAARSGETPRSAVFRNALVRTMDKTLSTASVLAVKGQNIVYVGDDAAEAARLAPAAKELDLDGKTVVPGLIEGHMHFLGEGQRLSEVDMFLKPKEEILRLLAEEVQKRVSGEWITGRGWNNETWPDRQWPAKEELDAVAPRNPVALTRADGHSMWVNSRALEAAGITADTPDPQGGEIFRNPAGEPQGILVDTPIVKIWAQLPAPTEDQIRFAYREAEKELFAYGVTSLVNASQTLRNHTILRQAYEADELKIRVYEMLAAHSGQDLEYLAQGGKPYSGHFDERLSLRAVKLIGDGSLGSRSAWMLQDYADRQGHKGNGRYSDAELYDVVRRSRENGFQACVHAIGDACVRQTIDVMEKVLRDLPSPDHRFRIEHFQIVAPEDLARTLRLGIIPSMQTIHEVSDKNMTATRLAPEAVANSYNWRGVIDGGGVFPNGSDAPMEKVNPFLGMHAAVTRNESTRRMTRVEALQSYTTWAAFAEFAENRKGSLEVGKLADFAVLDRDVASCPSDDILNTRVLLTVAGGEIVYEK